MSFVAKCHNVAMVATARKLAVIAWRMLSTGEPYRYAQPAATATKLASLRIAVTGEKRRHLKDAGTLRFAEKINAPQVIARKPKTDAESSKYAGQ